MKVKVTTNKTEYEVNIDKAWVWVRLEDELGMTLTEAQEKMANGSTKVITYAIWLATETDEPYKNWLESLITFDIDTGDEDPKE